MVEYNARQLDAVYAAIAHPVRRRVLDQLRPGAATVTELAAAHPMSLAAVSKHIRVLEDAGLVRRTIHGRKHHLVLEPTPLDAAAGWLGTYRRFWEDRLDLLEAKLRASKRR
ncbi:MAG: metalloregulator ArsR/SmtB family transcription factor [Candidatus Dormibacter sp.]